MRRLTQEKGDPSTEEGLFFQGEPAWSPDGRRIAFSSVRDGTSHIYVMSADGTGTRRLTTGLQNDNHPSWSPDGKTILFAREGALFVIPAGGPGPARRVGRGLGAAADPAWSPDGTLIAYDYRRPGEAIKELYVMRANGTRIRRLTNLGQVSTLPAWSPDGKRLAFQSDLRLGHDEIYTIGVGGQGLKEITTSALDAYQPAWSPDGEITYARDGSLWTTDAAGHEARLVKAGNASSPAWRPVPPQ